MIARIAVRSVFRHRLRSAFVIAGIAIAIALLADMLMLSGGMERTFRRVIEQIGYEVRVCPPGTMPFTTEAVIAQSGPVARRALEDPRVDRVLRVLGTTLYAASDGTAVPATVMGIDGARQTLYTVTAGNDIADVAVPDGVTPIAINANLAETLGLAPGDAIRLQRGGANAASPFRASLDAVVTGIARIEFDLEQQRTVVAPLADVQRFAGGPDDAASFILIKVAGERDGFVPLDKQRAVAASLQEELPELSVFATDKLFEALSSTLAYFEQFALILATISVIITFLLIGVVLTIGVNERRGEIAALRSMGFRASTIRTMIFTESATLIVIASGLGAVIGWFLAGYLDGILTRSPSLPAGYSFFVPQLWEIAAAIGITGAVGALAALYPAILATRIDIPQTLHEEAM